MAQLWDDAQDGAVPASAGDGRAPAPLAATRWTVKAQLATRGGARIGCQEIHVRRLERGKAVQPFPTKVTLPTLILVKVQGTFGCELSSGVSHFLCTASSRRVAGASVEATQQDASRSRTGAAISSGGAGWGKRRRAEGRRGRHRVGAASPSWAPRRTAFGGACWARRAG